jgi:hypothetical protein
VLSGRFWAGVGLLLMVASGLRAQSAAPEPEFAPYEEVPGILTVLSPFLLPKVLADTWTLRDYVRGEEFLEFRTRWGDRYAVDAIFDTAVRLCWNNTGLALLISFLASMDHRRVGVDLPVVGPLIWLPLTSEFEEEFQERVERLPCAIYADTGPDGCDRDKLQHFFGSAFLAYVTESRGAAQRVGDFVEWGEGQFIVGGANEPRDLRANHQGQMFGLALLSDHRSRPSAFLITALARPGPSTPASHAFPLTVEER